MSSIALRLAGADDAEVVATLIEALLRELGEGAAPDPGGLRATTAAALGAEAYAIFLAESGGEPVGVMTLEAGLAIYAEGPIGTLRELWVDPRFRSSGLGAQFIARAREHARGQGWRRIEVTAPEDPSWIRTVDFYRAVGFRDAGPKLALPV